MKRDPKAVPGYLASKGELAMKRYNEFAQFRQNLLVLRAYSGFTLEKMGELLNIRPSRVNDYEIGRCHPSFDELRLIAKHFDVTLDQLMYKKTKLSFEE